MSTDFADLIAKHHAMLARVDPRLAPAVWRGHDLFVAVHHLSLRHGIYQPQTHSQPPRMPNSILGIGDASITAWLEATAQAHNIECCPIQTTPADMDALLASCAPAVLAVPTGYIAVLHTSARSICLLGPDLQEYTYSGNYLETLLIPAILSWYSTDQRERWAPLLHVLGEQDSPRLWRAVRRMENRESRTVGWMIRIPPQASVWQHLRQLGIVGHIAAYLAVHTFASVIALFETNAGAGNGLQGSLDWSNIHASWLLGISTILLFVWRGYWQNRIALSISLFLRQRMLSGALSLPPHETRGQGAGQILGRSMEAQQIETLALGLSLQSVLLIFDLGFAAAVMSAGVAPVLSAGSFLGWCIFTGFVLWHSTRIARTWTQFRLQMTGDLVENMVGMRTRKVQEQPAHWHDREDAQLAQYMDLSKRQDFWLAVQHQIIPRGWGLLSFVVMLYAMQRGASAWQLAVTLLGMSMGGMALRKLGNSVSDLMQAWISWQQVGPLFRAARHTVTAGDPMLASQILVNKNTDLQTQRTLTALSGTHSMNSMQAQSIHKSDQQSAQKPAPILSGKRLRFTHPKRQQPILDGADIEIFAGDKILLQGASGAGKSTLAGILTGIHAPDGGLLLLHGFDQQSLGLQGWRKRAASAPQFHENHVFAASFAFNLLMGRRWPALPEDMQLAEEICVDLGLGSLLKKMPAGMRQQVGESGWQLSHGEKSRLFMARAILQESDVLFLDESFAALDPETLRDCLRVVLARVPTLVVIAHP